MTNKIVAGIGVTAFLLVTISMKWWLLIAVAGICAAVYGLAVVIEKRRDRKVSTAARVQGLSARADYEHRLFLADDPKGVHGQFPPSA